MIDTASLAALAAAEGLSLPPQTLDRFDRYAALLCEWNQKINLTTITAPEGIVIRHFLDSLLLLRVAKPEPGAAVIDVGAGAGFPSLPCKLARDDLRVTLLDSLQKRILFLEELAGELGIGRGEGSAAPIQCLHARAEEAGRAPEYRERYDLATARAVAQLRELSEYCLPFVRVGGCFVALKGGDVERELAEAEPAICLLGGRIEGVEKRTLPDGSGRSLIVIQKISQTPTKYPRNPAKMKQKPL